MSDCNCTSCAGTLERVRYFPRQLIKAEDMRAEQDYFVDKMRRHNRHLHGWGVVCGLDVTPPGKSDPITQVTICPGYLVTPQGDDVHLHDAVTFDVALGAQVPEPTCEPWPCPPRGKMPGERGLRVIFLAVRYAECLSRPVHVHPAGCGCGCGSNGCEHSRISESFEVKALWELPQSHIDAYEHDQHWRELVHEWRSGDTGGGVLIGAAAGGVVEAAEAPPAAAVAYAAATMFPASEATAARLPKRRAIPVPPCPPCPDDPWVVIAAVRLPEDGKPITQADISYIPRRVLWSVSTLTALLPI